MDIDINKYNHRKNIATACALLACLTVNAYMIAYTVQMDEYIEYGDAIKGVCGAAIFNCIWGIGTIVASLCMHMEKKEHQKKLDMVATWTVHSNFALFCLSIAAAVLGHLSFVALTEKMDALMANSSAGN